MQVTFGLPFGSIFELRTHADVIHFGAANEEVDGLVTYAGAFGARLRFNQYVPFYVQAMLGYEFAFGTRPSSFGDGAFVDVGAALHAGWCGFAPSLAFRYRRGISTDNQELSAFLIALEFEYGSTHSATGGNSFTHQVCGSREAPRRDLPPPPPPLPAPTPVTQSADSGINAGASVQVAVPRVEVQVQTQPVRVEVIIGAAIFGGAVRANLDLSGIPWHTLERSGLVRVEIIGPASELFAAQARLSAALSQRGIRVDGIATMAVNDPTIRAVFTVFPR